MREGTQDPYDSLFENLLENIPTKKKNVAPFQTESRALAAEEVTRVRSVLSAVWRFCLFPVRPPSSVHSGAHAMSRGWVRFSAQGPTPLRGDFCLTHCSFCPGSVPARGDRQVGLSPPANHSPHPSHPDQAGCLHPGLPTDFAGPGANRGPGSQSLPLWPTASVYNGQATPE